MSDYIVTNDWIYKMTKFARDFEIRDEPYTYKKLDTTIEKFLKEEYEELDSASAYKDNIEILDGAADVAFIALNCIYKLGRIVGKSHEESTLLIKDVMNEVCTSNLSKLTDKGEVLIHKSTGKVLKPDTYSPPNLSRFIDA